ncbi:hypothetical protein ACFY5A_03770 [Microbacterium sp. NPDC012755]|uniref:hypothetical protein n=1 Tax=Microbacterium sp. NPDC012755 TaxID=3364184 RepID=UPI003673B72E
MVVERGAQRRDETSCQLYDAGLRVPRLRVVSLRSLNDRGLGVGRVVSLRSLDDRGEGGQPPM